MRAVWVVVVVMTAVLAGTAAAGDRFQNFERPDTDRDGEISAEEREAVRAERARRRAEILERYDADRQLSHEEREAGKIPKHPKHRKRRGRDRDPRH